MRPEAPGNPKHLWENSGVTEQADRVHSFSAEGYLVAPGLFEPAEIDRLRAAATAAGTSLEDRNLVTVEQSAFGEARISRCDLLAIPELRHVLLDPRIVELATDLLGHPPVYFGDSSLRLGKSTPAWHKDNVDRVDRRGPDWLEEYPLVRMGLYLQDHRRHSGALALRPGSHRGPVEPSRARFVDLGPGDVAAWNLRMSHVGDAVRLRWRPDLVLAPKLQIRMPRSLTLPEERPRIALFMTFGRPSPLFDRYLDYLGTREYAREQWENSHFSADVWAAAAAAGIEMVRPVPGYGSPEPVPSP